MSANFELLDQALRSGSLAVEGGRHDQAALTHAERVRALCEEGLVSPVVCPSKAFSAYVITDWGRVVWKQEKLRAERRAFADPT
jgi:hypothetical protein